MPRNKEVTTSKEFSKIVFSKSDRIQVWGAVARFAVEPPEQFSRQQIIDSTEGNSTTVTAEFEVLKRLGMISYANCEGYSGNTTHWFVRTDSPAWGIVEAAVDAVDTLFPEE